MLSIDSLLGGLFKNCMERVNLKESFCSCIILFDFKMNYSVIKPHSVYCFPWCVLQYAVGRMKYVGNRPYREEQEILYLPSEVTEFLPTSYKQ